MVQVVWETNLRERSRRFNVRLTIYDRALAGAAGRVGVHGAVRDIRRKIYNAIAAACPEFALKCERQMNFRDQ